MNKDQLRVFVEVVDCGSINKAAERLYLSQPSLSRSIHALEEEMGRELIKRTNRGVSATPAGETFYYYARSILDQFHMLERLKTTSESKLYSKLCVSIDNIFLRDDLILEFYKRIQSEDTEIHMIETTAENVLNNVHEGKSELGITILNQLQFPIFQRMCEWKNLDVEVLDEGPLYIQIHSSSMDKNITEIDSRELIKHTYVHLPYDFFSNLNMSLSVDGVGIPNLVSTITLSNYHAIINMLNHADTFLLGNKWQIEELANSNIRSLPLRNNTVTKSFVVIKRRREVLSSAGEVFFDIIKDTYMK